MLLEYDMSQSETRTEVGPEHRRETPKMVFLHQTRKVVVPAPRNQSPGTTASARAKIDWNWPRPRPRYAWPAAASDLVTAPSRAMSVPAPADFNDRYVTRRPVYPRGPLTRLGAFHHTPHTFKRARDREVRGLQWHGAADCFLPLIH